MKIVVPIHVAALRVSPSTAQTAKTALYDFRVIGQSPLSSGNNLIAADRFLQSEELLSRQPGIHLHWSLPKAWSQGAQSNTDGSINFPALPNRWLITRFHKNAGAAATVAMWLVEADAHTSRADDLTGSPTAIPWRDSPGLYGLGAHYIGRRIPLDASWAEPGNAHPAGMSYLSSLLKAPLAYGETFTAYYQHSRNLFGIHDDLKDLFQDPNQLELSCKFSVSYSVAGWVAPQANDVASSVLSKIQSPLADHIREVFEDQLRWSLNDYAPLVAPEAGPFQAILSGIVSGIQWDIAMPGSPAYPSALPDAGGVSAAIGNNTSEALSAYLSSAESSSPTTGSGTVTAGTEWLLNALQFGRLPYLGDGETDVGQLDRYLHARSFGSSPGGSIWSVRETATPGGKAAPKEPVEVTLPLPLARLLAELNRIQQQLDSAGDEIFTRRQKLFFDWCYSVNAIETNVIQGDSTFDGDISGDYLLDGLMQLFPCLARSGASSFRISAPAEWQPDLSNYVFNKRPNENAASLVRTILELFNQCEGIVPGLLNKLRTKLQIALAALQEASAGGTTAASHTGQAVAALRDSLALAEQLAGGLGQDLANALVGLKGEIDADAARLSGISDPVGGVFARFLPVTSGDAVPCLAGQIYRGVMQSIGAFANAGSWGPNGDFKGIKDLLDRLTGEGSYAPYLFDTQTASVYVGSAYFWRASGETASHSTPYYLQMALQEVANAQSDAQKASAALAQALVATSSATLSDMDQSLKAITAHSLPGILAALTGQPPDLAGAVTELRTLIDQTVSALIASTTADAWKTLIASLEAAWHAPLHRLPLAQEVSLLSTFLASRIDGRYTLATTPAPAWWQPNEPVLLLAESADGNLIKPVNRNGYASLLPCRLETELVKSFASMDWPDRVGGLASRLDPGVPGLTQVIQELVEEAWLLCPESQTAVSPNMLEAFATQNRASQFTSFDRVELAAAPPALTGTLPYYIAWNHWSGADPFLPLFLFWQAEFVFSKRLGPAGTIPARYLDGYRMDRGLVGYEPTPASIADFQKDPGYPNYVDLYGVTTLFSSPAANLCDQIRQYCLSTFDYDPSVGAPGSSGPHYDEEKLFFDLYSRFRTMSVLSQGLSGFNAGLLQRSSELQLPLNIPSSWVDPQGSNLPQSNFRVSQFLLNQSADWPAGWSSMGIDFRAFAAGDRALSFNPLRGGFMQLQGATLVDTFGRFVDLPNAKRPAVSESLSSETPSPTPGDSVYLPPRLVQPSRLLAQWISAKSPDGLGEFTEWNPHPAASPICGWLVPDHLDGSLMVYNGDGSLLGSLREVDGQVRWFVVPGEAYEAGADNRALMLGDLAARKADPELQSFLVTFVYPDESSGPARNFEAFLEVLDRARQFIVTKSMQEDQALAVLIGQPLALARCSIGLQLKGLPCVSLDSRTWMPWDTVGPQFEMDRSGYIPYNFGNFHNAGIADLRAPVRIGEIEYQKNGGSTPSFDDGVAGFFLNQDYSTFFTPVDFPDSERIRSTAGKAGSVAEVTPGGALTATLLLDPRASVHLTSGILPLGKLRIPPDQYAGALRRLMVAFPTAPVLRAGGDFHLPVPQIPGYEWSWWQVGQSGAQPVSRSQAELSAVFPNSPLALVDGWLRLRTVKSE